MARQYVVSRPLLVKIGAILVGAPAILVVLNAPVWGWLLGVAIGTGLYAISDYSTPGHGLLVALGVLLPGSNIGGTQIPLEGLSAVAVIAAYLSCFGVFDRPGDLRRIFRKTLSRT